MSDPGWAVELDGKPIALFGAAPAFSPEQRGSPEFSTPEGLPVQGYALPWLVGTDDLEKYPVHFFRVSRDVVDVLKDRYNYLENRTDARNTLSLRWLDWAGFTIEPSEPWGAAGMEFHRFWWRK